MQDGQYLRVADPAYEQVLDSLAMVAHHTPVPLLEALLKWRERYYYFWTYWCQLVMTMFDEVEYLCDNIVIDWPQNALFRLALSKRLFCW